MWASQLCLMQSAKAQASNYRFCTIEPNVGLVDVPDERIYKLESLVHPERIVPTQIEIVDIAGLVRAPVKERGWVTSSWRTFGKSMPLFMWSVVLKMKMY